jgi:hypothetical protein
MKKYMCVCACVYIQLKSFINIRKLNKGVSLDIYIYAYHALWSNYPIYITFFNPSLSFFTGFSEFHYVIFIHIMQFLSYSPHYPLLSLSPAHWLPQTVSLLQSCHTGFSFRCRFCIWLKMLCLSFWAWFISLDVMISSSIHFPVNEILCIKLHSNTKRKRSLQTWT